MSRLLHIKNKFGNFYDTLYCSSWSGSQPYNVSRFLFALNSIKFSTYYRYNKALSKCSKICCFNYSSECTTISVYKCRNNPILCCTLMALYNCNPLCFQPTHTFLDQFLGLIRLKLLVSLLLSVSTSIYVKFCIAFICWVQCA